MDYVRVLVQVQVHRRMGMGMGMAGDAHIACLRRHPNGEQGPTAPRRCAMRAGYGTNRAGSSMSTGPRRAPPSRATSIPILTRR